MGMTVVNLLMIGFILPFMPGERNRLADRLFALFCLTHAAANTGDMLAINQVFQRYPALIEVDTLCLLLVAPLLYGYVMAMTRISFTLTRHHLGHLLPMLLYFLWLLPYKLLPTAELSRQYQAWVSGRQPVPWMAVVYPKLVVLGYLTATYLALVRHKRTLPRVVSNLDNRELKWLTALVFALIALSLSWIGNTRGFVPSLAVALLHLGYSYWLAYHVITQPAIYTHLAPTFALQTVELPELGRYRNSSLSTPQIERLKQTIVTYTQTAKPYLFNELTLPMMAEGLRMPPAQLSQVLNEGFGENFYAFINRHRVEESKRLLSDPAKGHYSILAIAFEAGFNSKSTFNKTFRQQVGLPPSLYQQQHRSVLPPTTSDSVERDVRLDETDS